jgi:hypothetical protein
VPKDFVARITLDALSACIPAAHTPVQIKHIQGVVGYALYQEAELVLALAQLLLGAAPLGEVPGDFRVAQEVAIRVADRVDNDMRPKSTAVLPYPPALLSEPTLLPRRPQGGLRNIDGLVLFSVETGEMLSDNLAFVLNRSAPRFQLVTRPESSM